VGIQLTEKKGPREFKVVGKSKKRRKVVGFEIDRRGRCGAGGVGGIYII